MDKSDRVTGWWIFASMLLGIAGVLDVIWGIAAISDSKFFTDNSVFVLSGLHTWGWITLVVGVIQLFASFSLAGGGGFGRFIGIAAASLAAIAALFGTGTTPFWSLAVFSLSVIVLYQLAKSPDPIRS